ncbi:DMT family transporter [Desulfonatronospira sp.]|uniref:DMT family transporter n=1 Tax=Desulfonatronospira sp. TaxID=1962951 RepID=UPI0025C23292|nr:DMT family transporter [Desulfonatronospira sp.]
MKILYLLLALTAGIMMPLQAGINALLGAQIKSPILAAAVSFTVGAAFLVVLCMLLRIPVPALSAWGKLPLWMWTGGLLGAFFVTTTIILAPKLGAVTLLASLIAAQMTASIILDHYGLIGYPVQPVNTGRILGVIFLVLGVILVQRY